MKRVLIALSIILCVSVASAHPGGTDSQGGHRNSKTGEYHYHHGYSAHYHPGGICPYSMSSSSSSSYSSGSSSSSSYNNTLDEFTNQALDRASEAVEKAQRSQEVQRLEREAAEREAELAEQQEELEYQQAQIDALIQKQEQTQTYLTGGGVAAAVALGAYAVGKHRNKRS